MESVEPRRLAALPGYDTAPDIYETPELTDDTSTTIQTSPVSPNEASDSEEDDDDDDKGYGISRRRLYPEKARNRFSATSSRVDAKKVDLSDRVDGRRRGYRVKKRTDGGDGEEEEESLEARIARLRREIEECRAEAKENSKDGQALNDDMVSEVEGMNDLLRNLEVPSNSRQPRQPTRGARDISTRGDSSSAPDDYTLGKVSDFDTRLTALEQALGLSSLETATTESASTPVLPSLKLLDQQLSALTTAASLTNLDATSSRIEKLRRDAAELAATQADTADRPSATNGSRPPSSDSKGSAATLTQEDVHKLQALYQLLPTLQSLSPTVPAMLNRLRSLRTLHTNAATAASELVEIEKRQAEMDKELTAWKEGLERVEHAVQKADEANGKNGRVVEGWVKDLETRAFGSSR